jgi:hypothetical protein
MKKKTMKPMKTHEKPMKSTESGAEASTAVYSTTHRALFAKKLAHAALL